MSLNELEELLKKYNDRALTMPAKIRHLNHLKQPGRPGAYSMTLLVDVSEDEHPHGGVAAYRRGTKPGWLTLRAEGLEGEGMRDTDSIDLVADFNQQEGSPLRVMIGKQWTHWIAGPDGLNKAKVDMLLPSMSVEFHPEREVWESSKTAIELVAIVRRHQANRSTSISLPRFAIRRLLDFELELESSLEEGEEVRWLLEFESEGRRMYRGRLGWFWNPISCRFDRRRSTLKPIMEQRGRGWVQWDDLSQYNLESLKATVRMDKGSWGGSPGD